MVRTHAQVHPPRSAHMLADGRDPRSVASAVHPFGLGISGFSCLFLVVQLFSSRIPPVCPVSKWGANRPIL